MRKTAGRGGRGAVVALTGTALIALGLVSAVSEASSGFALSRLAGRDRYETAEVVATATFTQADTAVIASGEAFPDALAGSYLAGQVKGPILLTHRTSVPTATTAALQALKTRKVVLIGGPAAIDPQVETQLTGAGLAVSRVGGKDRFDTARLVAEAPGPSAVGSVGGNKVAIVVSGANFPDAISVGPMAVSAALPILLTDPQALSPEANEALGSLGIQAVLIGGGTAAVSGNVDSAITQGGRGVTRLAGADRTDTAARVADYELAALGFKNTHLNLARGDDFADALAGAVHGGADLAPTLLSVTSSDAGAFTPDWAAGRSATLAGGHVLGGTAAVASSVSDS
ncbi:MAG: cell wall-binding repeat-containing protein, partial [Acidimicrobiales bacterium]